MITLNDIHKVERQLQTRRPNHILHLLLSLITVGIWLPIWLLVSLNDAIERGRLERRLDKLTNKMLRDSVTR